MAKNGKRPAIRRRIRDAHLEEPSGRFDYEPVFNLPVRPEAFKDLRFEPMLCIDPQGSRAEDAIGWTKLGRRQTDGYRVRVGIAAGLSSTLTPVTSQLPNHFSYRLGAYGRKQTVLRKGRRALVQVVQFWTDGYTLGDLRVYRAEIKPRKAEIRVRKDPDGTVHRTVSDEAKQLRDILGTPSVESAVEHCMWLHMLASSAYQQRHAKRPGLYLNRRVVETTDPDGEKIRAQRFYFSAEPEGYEDLTDSTESGGLTVAPLVTTRPLRWDPSNISLHLVSADETPLTGRELDGVAAYFNHHEAHLTPRAELEEESRAA